MSGQSWPPACGMVLRWPIGDPEVCTRRLGHPGPHFPQHSNGRAPDRALYRRSVSIRAAFAFGDWPPATVAK